MTEDQNAGESSSHDASDPYSEGQTSATSKEANSLGPPLNQTPRDSRASSDSVDHEDPPWVRWAVYTGPLAAFLIVGALAPQIAWMTGGLADSPTVTLTVMVSRLALMLMLIAWALPRVLKMFPLRVSAASVLIGILGAVVWIGLCRLNLEAAILAALGLSPDTLGERDSIDPWDLFSDPSARYGFLVARFALLIVAVPVAEELLVRGFIMRVIESERWDTLPLSQVGTWAWVSATVYGVLSHPSEFLAAAIWFSLITWWLIRTGRFWDCVVAHAVTNALLGIYIITYSDWRLW